MADLSHAERSQNATLAYAPAGTRTDALRAQSARMIENVIKAHQGKPEIEIYLAIGSICPYSNKYDCAIWIEEVHRLMDGEPKNLEAA
jgi:hypothetical protein